MIAPVTAFDSALDVDSSVPTADERALRLLILIPVFNDWEVLSLLLPRIDAALADEGLSAEVLLVDDGSTMERAGSLRIGKLTAIERIDVLELARNLGHQRAIAIGLAWTRENRPTRTVVIADGDGEDSPADIPRLVEKFEATGRKKIIFAARTRRSEHWTFQLGYRTYQLLHVILTGQRVRVGNFSVVPPRAVARLAVISETWNHYAAAVFNSRLDYETLPAARGKRLGGRSRMNFTALVVHGLSALSVFSHVIGVRLLVATAMLICGVLAGFGIGLAAEAFDPRPMPAWTPVLMAVLLALLVQQAIVATSFVLLVLSNRQGASFIPIREYHYFVAQVVSVA